MRLLTILIIVTSLSLLSACDDTPAEREQKIDNAAEKTGEALQKGAEKTGDLLNKAADSTGKVINDVAEKTPRVDVDVDVTTRPSATKPMRSTTTTRPASP